MKVLKAIEVVKQVQLKGPSGGFVGNIITHKGTTGHELRMNADKSVTITHPTSQWSKEVPRTSIVAYEWYEEADETPAAKAK